MATVLPAREAGTELARGLDARAGRLRGAGAPVLSGDGFPPVRRFYAEDPYGSRLEFLEPAVQIAGMNRVPARL